MPKVAFLVPASPDAAFYSEIAAINLALKALPWRRWEPALCATMGSRMPSANKEDGFDRWRAYVREVEFAYVAESRWERLGHWAQVDATLQLAPRDADVYVTIDADTLPVAELESVLDEVHETQSIAGVMAHMPPPGFSRGMQDWNELSEKLNFKYLEPSFRYSLASDSEPDERRTAPLYFNAGVVFFSRTCFDQFVNPYFAIGAKLAGHLGAGADFAGQIAIPFVISENNLPAYALPMRYNYPNDDTAISQQPGELENAVIFHYLRTQVFDRHKIFTNAAEYEAFLGSSMTGTNLAFQNAVRRILGPTYPFPPPPDEGQLRRPAQSSEAARSAAEAENETASPRVAEQPIRSATPAPERHGYLAGKRLVVLLGAQRSGTTVIGRLAGKQPGARYAGEVFHAVRGPHDDSNYLKFFHLAEKNFFSFRESLISRFPSLCYPSHHNQRALWVNYLEFLFSDAPENVWVIDIKYNSLHHFDTVWHDQYGMPRVLEFLEELRAPILHVTRDDLFAQAVSELRSHLTGQWHLTRGSQGGEAPPPSLELDPAELERIMLRNARMSDHIREMLRFYPRRDEIEYGEVLRNGDLSGAARARIASLFGFAAPLAGQLDLRKMTTGELRDLILNHAMVANYFAGTQFEPLVAHHLKKEPCFSG